MSSIGPELPPHLLNQRRAFNDEDSDKEISSSITVGPQIPPGHGNQATPPDNENEDEDDYAPALPPDLAAARIAGPSVLPSAPSSASVSGKRQLGPSFPTYAPTYDPHHYQSDDDDDDDDDNFGPKPLPPGMQHEATDAVKEFMEKEEKRRKEIEEAAKPKALKRDEWMLVPPSSSDLLGRLDPTKLKARQFARSAAPTTGKTDNSLWTETPVERQQRLADEVSGKKRRVTDSQPVDPTVEEGRKRRKREEEVIRKGVEEYTQKRRGPALIEQHSAGKQADEDKTDNAIWDHSRDMSLGGRLMDDDKRNKLVREAKGLGDRFGTGKSGGFL